MTYRGSEAIDLDMQETEDLGYGYGTYGQPYAPQRRRTYTPARRAERPLVVVEGGHLDAEARQGVSPEFVRRARLVVVAVVAFCALGALRVALTAGTVSLMSANLTLSSHIEEADALNDELHAERSLLSSSSRIVSIATESYGMVYAPDGVVADVSTIDGDTSADGSTATSSAIGLCQGSEGTSADTAQDAD